MMSFGKTAGLSVALLAMLSGGGAGAATQKAGVAAAVLGMVEVSGETRAAAVRATSGMDVFLGDRVVSDEDSRMQMLLLDETVFSIGPNSDLVIDEFVYDPNTGGGAVAASFTRGLVRYVSGRIAQARPKNISIRMPVGTLGIRGTSLFMLWDPELGAYFMGLLGPGPRNNVDRDAGGFVFTNDAGDTVTVLRQGFGVVAREGEEPEVIRTPGRLIELLQQQFTASRSLTARRLASGGGEDASTTAGQTDATGQQQASAQGAVLSSLQSANDTTVEGSEEIRPTFDIIFNPGSGSPKDPSDPTPIQAVTVIENILPTLSVAVNQGLGRLPLNVTLPFAVQASWNNPSKVGTFFDIDVHLTGPDTLGGRFHVYHDNVGSFFGAPFALHDADAFGAAASEVIGISQLNAGGPYRASAFSFSDRGATLTTLADDSNLVLSLIRNGVISRGPGGSAVINGTILATATPPAGAPGNTFVGFELDPATQAVTLIQRVTNFTNSASVQ